MSLPAVRFRIPLGAEFSEKCHFLPSQYWDIISITQIIHEYYNAINMYDNKCTILHSGFIIHHREFPYYKLLEQA